MTDSMHNQTASTEPDLALTQEEHVFRAALLASAQRLDIPSPKLGRELGERIALERGGLARHWPRLRRPVAVACFGLAAGAALVVGLGVRHREMRVTAEPEALVVSLGTPTAAVSASAYRTAETVGAAEPQADLPRPDAHATAGRGRMSPNPKRTPSVTELGPQSAARAGAEYSAPVGVAAGKAEPRIIVWDGDNQGNGAHGWAGPTDTPKTRSTVKASPSIGFAGTTGIEWHGEGPEWTGFGWNWFSWYPSNGGTDISGYDRLVFKLRAKAAKPTDLPALESLAVSLISSQGEGQKCTGAVDLSNFAPSDLLDGKWHALSIPLKDMYAGEKAQGFDRHTAWEFRIGEWSPISRNFSIFIDDIGFEKDQAKGNGVGRKGR